jgi:hypothetical protein
MAQNIQNVLETDQIISALMDSVTIESLAAMTSQLASVATSKHTELDTKLTNEVSRLDASVAVALSAANKLEAYEKQQIEDILEGIIAQDGFQQLLKSACVSVNGVNKSLESVITAIVDAEKVTKTTMLTDADGNYNGAKLTLTSGSEAILDLVKTVEEGGTANEYNKYSFTTTDWAGSSLPAGFYINTKNVSKTLSMFGVDSVMKIGEKVIEQTNIVFDLTDTLSDCGENAEVVVSDLDGDGEIGVQDDSVL